MSWGLLALCTAAAAVFAWASSACAGVGLVVGHRWLARTTPAAHARLLFVVALLPALVTLLLLGASLAPAFGWVPDHCRADGDPHTDHPHVCGHHAVGWPGWPVALLVGLFGFSFALALGRVAWHMLQAERTAQRLAAVAGQPRGDGAYLLAAAAPQAFVLGVWKPRFFLTQGLANSTAQAHLAAVFAHEAAHLRRRDTLRGLLADLGCSLHLPGVAGWVRARLGHANEMAADEEAAAAVGSRLAVAQALVDLARRAAAQPYGAHAFAEVGIVGRVESLLHEGPRSGQPSHLWLGGALVAALAAAMWHTQAIHHGIEQLLGALQP